MPHPEHERIKISDPDDASHQHLITTEKHQNKYFGFDLHCSEVEIFKTHNKEESFTQFCITVLCRNHI